MVTLQRRGTRFAALGFIGLVLWQEGAGLHNYNHFDEHFPS